MRRSYFWYRPWWMPGFVADWLYMRRVKKCFPQRHAPLAELLAQATPPTDKEPDFKLFDRGREWFDQVAERIYAHNPDKPITTLCTACLKRIQECRCTETRQVLHGLGN